LGLLVMSFARAGGAGCVGDCLAGGVGVVGDCLGGGDGWVGDCFFGESCYTQKSNMRIMPCL
jgi:hypothetical protein